MNPFEIYLWHLVRLCQVRSPRHARALVWAAKRCSWLRTSFCKYCDSCDTHRDLLLGQLALTLCRTCLMCLQPRVCPPSPSLLCSIGGLSSSQAGRPAMSKATGGCHISTREGTYCSDFCKSFHSCFTRLHPIT